MFLNPTRTLNRTTYRVTGSTAGTEPDDLSNFPPLHTLSKGSANIGNGVITPTQIAFIVDLYLHDNRFSKSRLLFPSEASYLLSSSPVRDIYVSLREQKVVLEKEKVRVQNQLQGMQNVMNTYNSSLTSPPPLPVIAPASQQKNHNISSGFQSLITVAHRTRIHQMLMLCQYLCWVTKEYTLWDFFHTFDQSSSAYYQKTKGILELINVSSLLGSETTNRIPQADKPANSPSSQTLSLAKNSSSNKSMSGDVSRLTDSSLPTNSTCLMTPQKHASLLVVSPTVPRRKPHRKNSPLIMRNKSSCACYKMRRDAALVFDYFGNHTTIYLEKERLYMYQVSKSNTDVHPCTHVALFPRKPPT
ncbi:hypothetical protein YC2023_077525 [Brassica napus]